MKTIGLVGGVASGKSLVAALFGELGAGLLDADRVGHEVLARDRDVRQALVDRWGPKVLAPDGNIDRAVVAETVFAPGDQAASDRQWLESLLHPKIGVLLEEKKAQFAASGRPAVILDAPLLLEANWGPLCDIIVMVDAHRDARLARAKSRGWSEEEFTRRVSAQWPVERKSAAAHVTLANNGSIESLRTAVREIWDQSVIG